MVVADDGTIFVADAGIPALRAFSPDGTYLRDYGRPGEGPGEYLTLSAFGIIGDTVWVGDMATGRLTLFRRDGTLEASFVVGDPTRPPVVPYRILGADEFLVVAPPTPDLSTLDVGPATFRQSIVRARRETAGGDTIVTYDAEVPLIVTSPGGGGFFAYQPIRDGPQVSYLAQRDLILEVDRRAPSAGSLAEFGILVRSPAGDTIASRLFRDEPRPFGRAYMDSLRVEADDRMEGMPQHARDVVLEHLYLPQMQPPVSGAVGARDDGTFWVPREGAPKSEREILVLDRDLMPIATIALPGDAERQISPVSEDRLWFLERGEYDVPFLVRYRIVRD